MYGYIRPLKSELRMREFELYNAAYCGLCHKLGKDYGLLARFAVSYDCTLPALMAAGEKSSVCKKRCPARLGRKKNCLCGGEGLELSAAATVILAHYKLLDTVSDESFFKALGAKLILFFGKRKFAKAKNRWQEFAEQAEVNLSNLSALEKDPPSDAGILDRSADCFARVTAAFSLMYPEGNLRRLWHEIYYHIGRVIFILDAADDWAEDLASQRFNPAVIRYGLTASASDILPEETRDKITKTLEQSLASAAAAFELLPADAASPIIGNIIYLGIPEVISQVLNRTNKKRKKKG
ncbi:MAG: hypothetical protein IKM29_05555 [Clostridia bacterium]|nr:hypothetical protein [Clostridia bacterium]